ncbi:hypothetical protein LV89_01843 [Arcicella aurantiaca]|uniref:Uncharacterized protein n=1 Tax=Arcicella aurantiaca TaxID=591202 RepID=A0A316EAR4_9BACT|nr:hypothetical protein [Arcicella aurantiaca]PWK27031.1 hypothetical protein LV89_01843 [Arcicella aurantiaca]
MKIVPIVIKTAIIRNNVLAKNEFFSSLGVVALLPSNGGSVGLVVVGFVVVPPPDD